MRRTRSCADVGGGEDDDEPVQATVASAHVSVAATGATRLTTNGRLRRSDMRRQENTTARERHLQFTKSVGSSEAATHPKPLPSRRLPRSNIDTAPSRRRPRYQGHVEGTP